jgi:hypothetical protein
VADGQTATFSVVASGTAPLTYQWRSNGAAISGATSASYTTPATTAQNSGTGYEVVVKNVAGSVTAASNQASATTSAATGSGTGTVPTISTQPASQTVAIGTTATFAVAAGGTGPFTYQWQDAWGS